MSAVVVRIIFVVSLLAAPLIAADAVPQGDAQELQAQLNQVMDRMAAQDQRIAQQDAELAALRSKEHESWLNERRAEEVKQLVREVLADADTRASLLGEGHPAGYESGFFLASEDQKFLLKLSGMVQFRYIFSTSDNAFDSSDPKDLDDDRGGFEMRRARFIFKGHVIDPSIQYFLLFQVSRSDGDAVLLDGWVKKTLGEHWAIWAGQDKIPVWREWIEVAGVQPFVERSLLNSEFGGSYTQGMFASYTEDQLRLVGSINDGTVDLNGAWETEDVESVGISGRVDWLFSGTWAQHRDFTAWPAEEALIAAGAAVHFQQGEYGTTTDEVDNLLWSVDATAKYKNLAVYASLLGNHIRKAEALPDLDQLGVLIQGGWMITEDIELLARYEWGDLDVESISDMSIFTVGFTKYWHKHQLKWTTDAGYAFNPIENALVNGVELGWADDSTGWRADADDADGQIVIRSRIQLTY